MSTEFEAPVHNESTRGRQMLDSKDEDNLVTTPTSLKLFSVDPSVVLQNIVTRDLATQDIEENLLHARDKGPLQLISFVKERLLSGGEQNVKSQDPLQKNKVLTFYSLYNV